MHDSKARPDRPAAERRHLRSLHPAALKNLKMCYSSDPGRSRPNIFDLRVKMDSRTPRDRPGKHRWVQVGQQFVRPPGPRNPGPFGL